MSCNLLLHNPQPQERELRDVIVEIEASIEASNAAQTGTQVTFTQDAWGRSTA